MSLASIWKAFANKLVGNAHRRTVYEVVEVTNSVQVKIIVVVSDVSIVRT
jgi:enamine deaminase RidA (YjgF/YER057c/UK114 family)